MQLSQIHQIKFQQDSYLVVAKNSRFLILGCSKWKWSPGAWRAFQAQVSHYILRPA